MDEIKVKKKVCIVGSGFCGYAAYQKLKAQNIDLILIEGGKEKTPNSDKEQNFYKVVTNKFLTFSGKYKVNNKPAVMISDNTPLNKTSLLYNLRSFFLKGNSIHL